MKRRVIALIVLLIVSMTVVFAAVGLRLTYFTYRDYKTSGPFQENFPATITARVGEEGIQEKDAHPPAPSPSKANRNDVIFVDEEKFRNAFTASGFLAGDEPVRTCDLKARGVTGEKEARRAYAGAFLSPDQLDARVIEALREAAALADATCATAGVQDAMPLLRKIPWKIAVLKSSAESGFPHTQADVVCMPLSYVQARCGSSSRRKASLAKTLLHEKVHVFQRLQPDRTREIVRLLGYRALNSSEAERKVNRDLLARSRANPDLDGILYEKTDSGCVPLSVYNSDAPVDLGDATTVCANATHDHRKTPPPQYEHPYEHMAYEVAEFVFGGGSAASRRQEGRDDDAASISVKAAIVLM